MQLFKDLKYPYPYDTHEVHFGDTGRTIYVTFIDDLSKFSGENDLMKMIEAQNMGARAANPNRIAQESADTRPVNLPGPPVKSPVARATPGRGPRPYLIDVYVLMVLEPRRRNWQPLCA